MRTMTSGHSATQADSRLIRLLGGAELASLRHKLRRHFERRSGDAQDGVMHLSKLSENEHDAVTQLMGRPARAPRSGASSHSVRVDVVALNHLLQAAGIATSLQNALEQLDGPIVNRRLAKEELQTRWDQACHVLVAHGALKTWLQTDAAPGLLKRLSRQDPAAVAQLLNRADAVLQRLPAQGMTRAQLAADTLGNAHALDSGQATASLVLAVLQTKDSRSASEKESDSDANDTDGTDDTDDTGKADEADERPVTERTRDIWARAGVLVNELARPALYLNLPTQAHSEFQPLAGEPGYLSLRQLLRSPIAWDVAEQAVYVCENPNIVSIAADRLGATCAPLVCTEGMAAAAQRVLLQQLAQAGARLLYHGDFDWAGLHIAKQVMTLCGAQPWRFGGSDYQDAVANAAHTERDLAESTVDAPWDALLAPTMRQHGLAIAEEAVVASLLQDLG